MNIAVKDVGATSPTVISRVMIGHAVVRLQAPRKIRVRQVDTPSGTVRFVRRYLGFRGGHLIVHFRGPNIEGLVPGKAVIGKAEIWRKVRSDKSTRLYVDFYPQGGKQEAHFRIYDRKRKIHPRASTYPFPAPHSGGIAIHPFLVPPKQRVRPKKHQSRGRGGSSRPRSTRTNPRHEGRGKYRSR